MPRAPDRADRCLTRGIARRSATPYRRREGREGGRKVAPLQLSKHRISELFQVQTPALSSRSCPPKTTRHATPQASRLCSHLPATRSPRGPCSHGISPSQAPEHSRELNRSRRAPPSPHIVRLLSSPLASSPQPGPRIEPPRPFTARWRALGLRLRSLSRLVRPSKQPHSFAMSLPPERRGPKVGDAASL